MNGKKFENVYLRSNLQCDGTIPDNGFYGGSPDMFSNGTVPLVDFQDVLKTPENYSQQPADKSTILRDNYCYLRCKNNTDHTISAKAEMYYTTSSFVTWPDSWKPMYVDVKKTTLNDIIDIPAGGIGVVERPFIWNKPLEPSTNNHYCYIGRLTTETTQNPLPDVSNPIEMSHIIQSNLMFGQRNINIATIEPGYDGYYQTIINTSGNLTGGIKKYHLFFYSKDMAGWDVEVTCSMNDSQNRRIGLKKTKIIGDDDIYCGQCMLEPGYMALVTVYLYSNGNTPKETSSTQFILEYAVQTNELEYAQKLGVINNLRSERRKSLARINDVDSKAIIPLGGHTTFIRPKKVKHI